MNIGSSIIDPITSWIGKFKKFSWRLAFSDENDLIEYLPHPNRKLLPPGLRISVIDRWRLFVTKNSLFSLIERAQSVLVILMLSNYIFTTYDIFSGSVVFLFVDLFLSILYFCLMLLDLLGHPNKCRHVLKPYVSLDIVTVLPIMWLTFVDIILYFSLPGQRYFVPDVAPFLNSYGNATIPYSQHPWLGNYPNYLEGYAFMVNYPVFKVIKLLRIGVVIRSLISDAERHIVGHVMVMLTTVFTILTVFSSLIVIIENEIYHREFPRFQPLSLDQAAYIIFLTLATIGTSHIYPNTWLGKTVLCAFFVVGFVILLNQSKQMLTLLRLKGRELVQKAGIDYFDNHILVAGHASHIEILEFIKEFLSESHGKCTVNSIVIVVEDTANMKKVREAVTHRFFNERVSVVEGSIGSFELLSKVSAETAEAVFLLTDTRASNPVHQDARGLMNVLAIKNYSSNIPVYSQLLLEQNKKSFETAGCTITLCVESLKTNLLSNNIMSPGLSTLISNVLVSSSAEEVISQFNKKDDQEKDQERNGWILEYCMGCENELYCVDFSSHLAGLEFTCAARYIYDKFDVFLIGVHNEKYGVLLSPGTKDKPHHINASPGRRDKAIVMARSIFHAHAISICEITKHQLHDLLRAHSAYDDDAANTPIESFPEKPHMKPSLLIETSNLLPLDNSPATDSSISPGSPGATSSIHSRKRKSFRRRRKNSYLEKYDSSMPMESLRAINQKRRLMEMNLCLLEEPRKDTEILLFSARHLYDHIIIMGDTQCAVGITKYLRTQYISEERRKPILIISKDIENKFETLKSVLCWFEDVYVMHLNPTIQSDLERAGIQQAHAALYLTDQNVSTISEEPEIVDSDAIQILLTIQTLVPSLPSTAEIVFRRNIRYFKKLIDSGVRKKQSQRRRIMNMFRFETVDSEFETYCLTSEKFASGKVFSRSFFTRLLCHAYFTKEIIDIVAGFNGYLSYHEEPVCHRKKSKYVKDERGVHQIPVPKVLFNETFDTGFHYYLHKKSILIGIYRLNPHSSFRYVMCNPSKETVFRENDLLFLVGNYALITSPEKSRIPTKVATSRKRRAQSTASNPIDIVIEGARYLPSPTDDTESSISPTAASPHQPQPRDRSFSYPSSRVRSVDPTASMSVSDVGDDYIPEEQIQL